jgi:hypothetical protein
MKLKVLVPVFLLAACAQVTKLNLKKHHFGVFPKKIIWFQLDHFSSEHIGLLKLSNPNEKYNPSFNDFSCMGQTWDYTTSNLRPSADEVFLSQMTGKKNIQGKCEDYNYAPTWKYLARKDFLSSYVQRSRKPSGGIFTAKSCKKEHFYKELYSWNLTKKQNKSDETFHYSDNSLDNKKGELSFDRSCQRGECFVSFSQNIKSLYESFKKKENTHLMIIRNTQYGEYLSKKQMKKAIDELTEIDNSIRYFQKIAKDQKNMLVLITSAAPIGIEYPKMGSQWIDFKKKGKNILYKRKQIFSPVFATGARAENFCGVYDQSEILFRLVANPEDTASTFEILNPFSG